MSSDMFDRTRPLLGDEAINLLKESRVCICGLGGVGSYAFEALVRAGVGKFTLVDHAMVDATNLNRQLIATHSTIGRFKTETAAFRAADINPDVGIDCRNVFINEENIRDILPEDTAYVVDAIDTVYSKVLLAVHCSEKSIPLISCMGTGNKIHPEKLRIGDIFKTSVDPLARIMRSELKKRDVKSLRVIWSDEKPLLRGDEMPLNAEGKRVPASVSYVPSAAGIMMASVVINGLTGKP